MRFIALQKSESGHNCCFDYTIYDTTRTLTYGEIKEPYPVCECRQDDLELILSALNKPETI